MSDAKFVCNIPEGSGNVVAMCVFKDRIYVAMQFGVFRLNADDKLEQMTFISVPPEDDE